MNKLLVLLLLCTALTGISQDQSKEPIQEYKKRVLETTEVDFLTSYYTQDGDHAAVSGGIGTEKLTDKTATIIVSIPLNDDNVLTIDAGISAYTSASSSNIDPFDHRIADPFVASSGASKSDSWKNLTGSFSHSSDDRNAIWTVKTSLASEYDYFSVGIGGSYARLFNEKNTEVSINGNLFLDKWSTIYPFELRPFEPNGNGINDPLFTQHTITGNANYNPQFIPISEKLRNSYSLGLGFSQILTKKLQGALAFDLVLQTGLLSTPFQRVYFSDIAASYIDQFRLAGDIERLPDSRLKIAVGGRLNYYLNEIVVVRTYYRYYFDDWAITSHTASIEIPIKVTSKFTLYPSYRYYNQTAADYFASHDSHLSTEQFYTSDYDLSAFNANQYGFGVTYTDIFTKFHLWSLGLKSIDVKFDQYARNTNLHASILSAGIKFSMD